jgi:thiol-disulfide isomerase/thioredoxin
VALLAVFALGLHAAEAPKNDAPKPGEPTDTKARKTFASAVEWERHHDDAAAMDDYRKANKQDGGHCSECLRHAFELANRLNAYKDAVAIARDWVAVAELDMDKMAARFDLAHALQAQGLKEKKDALLEESCEEFRTLVQQPPKLARAHYDLGYSLAYLHKDEAARAEFAAFLEQDKSYPSLHPRAERLMERTELARATMAPPFSVTTLDGRRISMDSLAGKVVLIDFWATWCGPCREALPHIRRIAQKFDGQPLVVLSISLDSDEAKWKDFVGKNGMTWLQYRDGGFTGPIANQFSVKAIPATFTIDADGVLEDQHVGDVDIEGKLKKLVARAAEAANRKPAPAAAEKSPGGGE